jgi:hypothetical protein
MGVFVKIKFGNRIPHRIGIKAQACFSTGTCFIHLQSLNGNPLRPTLHENKCSCLPLLTSISNEHVCSLASSTRFFSLQPSCLSHLLPDPSPSSSRDNPPTFEALLKRSSTCSHSSYNCTQSRRPRSRRRHKNSLMFRRRIWCRCLM